MIATQGSENIYILKYASRTGPTSGIAYEVAFSKNGKDVITRSGRGCQLEQVPVAETGG